MVLVAIPFSLQSPRGGRLSASRWHRHHGGYWWSTSSRSPSRAPTAAPLMAAGPPTSSSSGSAPPAAAGAHLVPAGRVAQRDAEAAYRVASRRANRRVSASERSASSRRFLTRRRTVAQSPRRSASCERVQASHARLRGGAVGERRSAAAAAAPAGGRRWPAGAQPPPGARRRCGRARIPASLHGGSGCRGRRSARSLRQRRPARRPRGRAAGRRSRTVQRDGQSEPRITVEPRWFPARAAGR